MIMQPSYTNYVVSFSFKNYLRAKSGMPKVILDHQIAINNSIISYVYLYSVKKTVINDKWMLFCYFGLIIDGVDYGVFTIERIIHFINDWNKMGYNLINIHIHHLLFTDTNKIEKLLTTFERAPIQFFLHDYYLCCKSYHLKGADGEYCGATDLSHEHCNQCEFYEDSVRFVRRIRTIVERYLNRAELIVPSESTREIYSSFWPKVKNKIRVIPHQMFIGQYKDNMTPIEKGAPIRVAYLGVPENYKGWDVWEEIVFRHRNDTSYLFYVFNNKNIQYSNMHHINVEFSSERQNAMVEAVRGANIDVALFWGKVPETYSYTCMEAFASNVFILTNSIRGNIQDFVKMNNAGLSLRTVDELMNLFDDSDALRRAVNDYYIQKQPSPLILKENDEICISLRALKIDERVFAKQYQVRETIWLKGIRFLYDHFVKKY